MKATSQPRRNACPPWRVAWATPGACVAQCYNIALGQRSEMPDFPRGGSGMIGRAARLFFASIVLWAPAQPVPAAPKVIVTIKPLHALVAEVMAGIATPQIMVKGATSPHAYTLKPSDIGALNRADIFFRASGATEPFSSKIVATLPKSVEVVTLQEAPGVALFPRRAAAAFGPDADRHREGHRSAAAAGSPAFDGHIWLDPDNAKAMAARIEEVLSARDPGNASRFKANAAALKHKLEALRGELQDALAPLAGKPY